MIANPSMSFTGMQVISPSLAASATFSPRPEKFDIINLRNLCRILLGLVLCLIHFVLSLTSFIIRHKTANKLVLRFT
jgi:hypothetical protein